MLPDVRPRWRRWAIGRFVVSASGWLGVAADRVDPLAVVAACEIVTEFVLSDEIYANTVVAAAVELVGEKVQ